MSPLLLNPKYVWGLFGFFQSLLPLEQEKSGLKNWFVVVVVGGVVIVLLS